MLNAELVDQRQYKYINYCEPSAEMIFCFLSKICDESRVGALIFGSYFFR